VVVYVCNASNQEAEAGGSQVQSQPGLHSKNVIEERRERGSITSAFSVEHRIKVFSFRESKFKNPVALLLSLT
jgi:hypothetical protein